MRLNNLSPADGSRPEKRRVGRGVGSGLGKTCGRGHKGQKARAGGYHKVGFEGGQMPLQRRLPKRGFRSRTRAGVAEIRLDTLNRIEADVIDMDVLKAARLVRQATMRVKVIASGQLERAVTIRGLSLTAGAAAAVAAAGGKVEGDG